MKEEIFIPREIRQPLAIDLTFRSHFRGCEPSDHFIPRFFTGLEHIMLYFPELNDPGCCGFLGGHSYLTEAGCLAHPTKLISERAITKKIDLKPKLQGEVGMAAAIESITHCRQLWMEVNNLDAVVPFHQGGEFYVFHAWSWKRWCRFGNERPAGVTRHLITCEEMMENKSTAV